MNTLITKHPMALALCVSGLLLAQATSAQTFMEVVSASGPNESSPNSWRWRTNGAHYLETGRLIAGNRANDPSIYQPVILNKLLPEDNAISTSTASWMGTFDLSNPALTNETGCKIYSGVKIISPQTFRLADVRAVIKSTDSANSLKSTNKLDTISYSPVTVGIYWGQDGVKGTEDDVRVTSGPATQDVNELYFIGVSSFYYANTPGEMQDIHDYINQQTPAFAMIIKYELFEQGSATVIRANASKILCVSPTLPAPPIMEKTFIARVKSLSVQSYRTYHLQESTNLVTWNNHSSYSRDFATTISITLPAHNNTNRPCGFYRMVAE